MKYIPIILLLLLPACPARSSAQTHTIDVARQKLYTAGTPQQRLNALLDLCEEFQSLERDTLDKYALEAKTLAAKIGSKEQQDRASLAYANSYFRWGWTDSALAMLQPALKNSSLANERSRNIRFKMLRQQALCYGSRSMFPDAMSTLFQLLREAEKYKDTLTICMTLNSIGSASLAQGKTDEALNWIFKAERFCSNAPRFTPALASIYVNAAYAYLLNDKKDSAYFFIHKALPPSKASENLNILATALRVQSKICSSLEKFDEAETALLQMMATRKKTDGASIVVEDNLQLADFYAGTGQLDKAIALCRNNLDTGSRYGSEDGQTHAHTSSVPVRLLYYEALARYYKQARNNVAYEETLEQIIAAKDTVYRINSAEALAEVEAKYELQKKETLIAQQQLDITKRKYLFYGSLVLVAVICISAFIIFKNYRKKQRLVMEFALREEREQSLRAINEAEENERKRIAADLHDNLGAQVNALLYGTGQLQEQTNQPALVNNLHFIASDMLQSLRETIWAMKQTDVAAAQLWLRVISFSKRLGLVFKRTRMTTSGDIPPDVVLPAARALHIILIVQEAVNNAIRHANAQSITIVSSYNAAKWTISVKDDGRGFDPVQEALKQEGSGLANMKHRAAVADADFTLQSDEQSGTTVSLIIPLVSTANNPKEVLHERSIASSFTA